MIADVANSIAAYMVNYGDPSDAVRQEHERDPIVERVGQHINTYARRSKLIEFPWIEKDSNAMKQVDFRYEKEFIGFYFALNFNYWAPSYSALSLLSNVLLPYFRLIFETTDCYYQKRLRYGVLFWRGHCDLPCKTVCTYDASSGNGLLSAADRRSAPIAGRSL
jgi:hypothetical protein